MKKNLPLTSIPISIFLTPLSELGSVCMYGILLFLLFIIPPLQAQDIAEVQMPLQDTIPKTNSQTSTNTNFLLQRLPQKTNMLKNDPLSLTKPEEVKEAPVPISFYGYYRLFLYGREFTRPYPNLAPFEKAYGVGDGYREPMLSFNIVGRPNGKTSFATEVFFFTPYFGDGNFEDNQFTLNLGLNFYGNFRTDYGNFNIRAGGIHWYNLSPFTMGVYQVLDRYSIFDRTPWEGVAHTDKYDSYFESGSLDRGLDRWNYQAFQGFILNGSKLPGDLAVDLFYGKTQPNGGLPDANDDPLSTIFNFGTAGNVPTYQGFNGDRRVEPSYLYGGKLRRTFGKKKHEFAYNTIVSHTALDSLGRNTFDYEVHTLTLDVKIDKLVITGELGASAIKPPGTTEKDWGEALMLRFYIPEEYTFLPLDIQLYQISEDFFNQNGEIATNSNPEIQAGFPADVIAGQISTGGLITQVNQLAHNRRGVNVNTTIDLDPVKLTLGWGLAEELEAFSGKLTYIHRINGLALSRVYNPFPANAVSATTFGPFGRQFSFFRGVSEIVQTTDVDPATGMALTKKYFNAVDVVAKYKTYLLDKPAYIFYLGSFGSASSQADLIPTLNDESYLFVQYHEFDLYYEVFDKFLLTGYFGIENARGGRFTEWDLETQLPRDQLGTGIGIGFDWTVAPNAGIYYRQRWMNFRDRSFAENRYKGNETTVELKIYF